MFHAADGYDRLMGRYVPSLARVFADFADVQGGRLLDVGCGPGGLTRELALRAGAENVTAIDPSPPFVAACRERVPGAAVWEGVAEALPFDHDAFDAALASLVVGFMTDPQRGVREMGRVTRSGGVVALCAWDRPRMPAIALFWDAVARATGGSPTDRALAGSREGEIADLLEAAGLRDVVSTALECQAEYADFDDLWSGYTAGIGPVGQYLVGLPGEQAEAVRDALRESVPEGPFALQAVAWAARGTV
ncbi:class I SAM-dependent methyltransferase [Microbacterium sp.]|uniref:class I SAM-dependent methyltransferase n=1 Tax=Microbacterium sp. TaxID=51671 RepID=UPI002810B1AE|nr:methyltransferase domain-containing protein [Microbacterium sp.]